MEMLYQREVPLLSSFFDFFPFFALCYFFFVCFTLIVSTPRDFRTNIDDNNSEILWGGWYRATGSYGDITWAVREMMNYTLPAKEFSVFSQIAE